MRLPLLPLAIIALGCFSMVGWGWALWQFLPRWFEPAPLTAKAPPAPSPAPVEPIMGTLQIFAESPLPPTLLEVHLNEQLFLRQEQSGADTVLEESWTYPSEGATAALRAEWMDYLPGPRAVRVRFFFDGVLISDVQAWGRDQVLTASWPLPGGAEVRAAGGALAPPLLPQPAPGQSAPTLITPSPPD